MFVDPHIHLWHPRETPRAVSPLVRALGWSPRLTDWVAYRVFPREAVAFFASPEHLTRPYLPSSFDADRGAHPVDGVVHIEAGWEGKGPSASVDETRWLAQLTQVGACRIDGMVAHVDLTLGDGAAEVIRLHREASDRVVGIRDTLSWHPSARVMNGAERPDLLDDARWRRGFERLVQERGLVFEATVYGGQLDELTALASAYPEQRIVLSHLGTPIAVGGPFAGLGASTDERERILRGWQRSMARLAEHENVFVKLSGLAMPICGFGWERRGEEPSVNEVCDAFRPLVDHAIEVFGAERCMFASNFPIDKVSLSYERLYDAFLALSADRTTAERDALFRETAVRSYGLEERE